MVKVTKKKFREAVKGTGGIMISIAKNLGVSRVTVYDFCNKNPDMMKLRRDEEEKIIDIAENSLFSQARKQEQWAVKYLLQTKGKRRGYVEKSEIQMSGHIETFTKEEREAEIKRLLGKNE